MTSSEFRFRRLAIKSFRGFRDSAEFDLDATTVIFTGPNGTGKTSVFDALQWVMLGTIERLAELRGRRNVEHIVNSYRPGERAEVALDVVADGRPLVLRRRGRYDDSTLEIKNGDAKSLFGEQAEAWLRTKLVPYDPDAFATVLTTCGLLQQDVMRSVLEARGADRYRHISAILGLGELEDFEHAVQEAAKAASARSDLAKAKVARSVEIERGAETRLQARRQRATQGASVMVARQLIREKIARAPAGVQVALADDPTADQARGVAGRCRELQQQIGSVLEEDATLRHRKGRLVARPTADRLEGLFKAAEEALAAVQVAATEERKAAGALQSAEDASEQLGKLAAIAIPLLSDRCPVCSQSIDPAEVGRQLRQVAADTVSLVEARRSLNIASEGVGRARRREQAVRSEYDAARAVVEDWGRVRQEEETLRERISALGHDTEGVIAIADLDSDHIEAWAPGTAQFLDELGLAAEAYIDAWVESRSTGEIERAGSELRNASSVLKEERAAAAELALRATRVKQMAKAVRKARVDVTDARFMAIEPLVTDIYSRLDPHPTFKSIGFKHDMYYGKGTSSPVVSDEAAGVEADPLIIFSASQANIAALSYFLAMSLGAGERALPFVLLDDPLQSMDDVNVLGFADLCRFVRARRQLVVSTHDRRFANLLRRKLAPREPRDQTIVHEFTGWDRRGPAVATDRLVYDADDSQLRLLQKPA